jgi:Tfp pilus assembly protein PilX
MKHLHLTRQRGAAALFITSMLFLAMALTALLVNRNLVFEQRSATNQYRATQAFEAAEAGLEWATAQLNNPEKLGTDCRPSADNAAARTFRQWYASIQASNAAKAQSVPGPSCVQTGAGWACQCGNADTDQNASTTAFSVQFLAGERPSQLRVVSTGCVNGLSSCRDRADATAQVAATVALLPALRSAPAAPLTARGAVQADGAIGLHNADAATGWAVHAGGAVALPQARVNVPAGAPRASAWVAGDEPLAHTTPERFFANHFGMDKTTWKQQPAVKRVVCQGDCTAALQAAAASPLIWVDGDLTLSGALTLGSAEQPTVLIVTGAAQFEGSLSLTGVVYAHTLRWLPTGQSTVHGAVLTEGDAQASGTPELFYDAAVLAQLTHHSGSWVRVGGSWRDF